MHRTSHIKPMNRTIGAASNPIRRAAGTNSTHISTIIKTTSVPCHS